MILVFGQSGQVARELALVGGPDVTCLGRSHADLTRPETCLAAIRALKPKAVINAAAYTAVDRAESEEALARQVNATAPGEIARLCAELALPMVHISTDYVFDGQGTSPHFPGDPVGPLGAYGRTKLGGEDAVRGTGGTHAILRTSWVFSAHGANFVKTMLRLGAERESLRVVADQIGGPTPARAIAQACLTIADRLIRQPGRSGTYHFAGAPDTSWAGFAREIMAGAGLACRIDEIPTADYPTPAQRPLNSRLDCSTTETAFGIRRPGWREGLAETLRELADT